MKEKTCNSHFELLFVYADELKITGCHCEFKSNTEIGSILWWTYQTAEVTTAKYSIGASTFSPTYNIHVISLTKSKVVPVLN
jgi:hypothetical protein